MDIREIAKRAKVSTATVSRTINRIPTANPALAKRVWKVVHELGYYPNTQARALVSGRSRIFGLIVSEITNPIFPEIVQVFETIAVEHGYAILLMSTVHDPLRMEMAVRRMIERRVDGVAVVTFGMESYEEKVSIPRDLSVVGFDDIRLAQFVLPALTTVQMSQAELGRLAFHALLEDVQRDSPAPHGTEYVLKTALVLRQSSALTPESQRFGRNGKG